MNPLAITGVGVVSAVGIGREAFFRALTSPVSIETVVPRPLESFDGSKYGDASNVVVEALGFDAAKYLGDKGLRTLDRLTKILLVATRLALHDAAVKKDGAFVALSPERVGVCVSNAYGSLEAITELDRVAKLEDARYINPAKFPNTVSNSASGYASIWEDLRALNVSVSDGNCGALDAVACADIHLGAQRADALVVGGVEAMSEPLYLAFQRLGALDVGARIGEGAALFVLEPLPLATARKARVFAQVIGYGTAFGAPEGDDALIVASAEALEDAIRAALADAKVTAAEIDVVASGMSGLRLFDRVEEKALRKVLGEEVTIAAPKRILGETLGAGGSMGMCSALAWFDGAPPAIVVRERQQGRDSLPVHVLVTSMGYYGNASAVVLRRGSSEGSSS